MNTPRLPRIRLLLLVLTLAVGPGPDARAQEFVPFTEFSGFERRTNAADGSVTLDSPEFRPPAPWSELLLSWNASTPGESGCEFQAQAVFPGRRSAWYGLGHWAEQTNFFPRRSLGKQKDADGAVDTDVLRLAIPAPGFRVRAVLHPARSGALPELSLLAASVVGPGGERVAEPQPESATRAMPLPVPELSQHAYAGGRSWCSPTSVSMVLGYWAERMHRPGMRVTVPEAAAGVFDPGWGGTGNWPFNTAYAARFPGLRAGVVRLRGLPDLERLVGRGVPVIVSVSLNLLRGRPAQEGDGHLVVVTGFDTGGDVWVNDPDTTHPPVPGRTVRRLYRRADLDRGWAASRRTAYVIQDRSMPLDWCPAR